MSQSFLNAENIQNIITSYNSQYIESSQTNNQFNTLSTINNYCISSKDNFPYKNTSYAHYIKKKKAFINNIFTINHSGLSPNFHQKQIYKCMMDLHNLNKNISKTKENKKLFFVNNIIYQSYSVENKLIKNRITTLRKKLENEYHNEFSDNRNNKLPLSKRKIFSHYLHFLILRIDLVVMKFLINILIIVLILTLIYFYF
jgi:hypothetical protein